MHGTRSHELWWKLAWPPRVNKPRIRILHWRLNEEINQEEFGQLYQGWLEAKGITNIFGTRQLESFDKVELYSSEKLSRDMLTIIKVFPH